MRTTFRLGFILAISVLFSSTSNAKEAGLNPDSSVKTVVTPQRDGLQPFDASALSLASAPLETNTISQDYAKERSPSRSYQEISNTVSSEVLTAGRCNTYAAKPPYTRRLLMQAYTYSASNRHVGGDKGVGVISSGVAPQPMR